MFKNLLKFLSALAILSGGYFYISKDSYSQTLSKESQNPIELAQINSENSALELKVHQQVNQYRKSRNLPPLTLDNRITQQSRLHSQKMAAKTASFSHDGFQQRVDAMTINN